MVNWETAFSFCSCSCQKSSQIPQNHWAGVSVYWCLKREHHQVIPPKLCGPPLASSSISDHWRCARCLRPRLHRTAVPQQRFPCLCTVDECTTFGACGELEIACKWAIPFFCGVSELPISPNLLRGAPVTSMMGITRVFWAVPLLVSERPEGGACRGGNLNMGAFSIQDDIFRPC